LKIGQPHGQGLKRIVGSGENDRRRYLLQECLEAYSDLDRVERERFQALLDSAPYQEVKTSMITTFEQGQIAGRRETALMQLEEKFGPLSLAVRHRVETFSADELRQLTRDLLKAQSLKELRLVD
jgi:hypothetical protein